MSSSEKYLGLEENIWCGLNQLSINRQLLEISSQFVNAILSNAKSDLEYKLDETSTVLAYEITPIRSSLFACIAYKEFIRSSKYPAHEYKLLNHEVMTRTVYGDDGLHHLGMVLSRAGVGRYLEYPSKIRPSLCNELSLLAMESTPHPIVDTKNASQAQQEAEIIQLSSRR